MTETIFALATGPGRAALAVMRISGPRAGWVLNQIAGRRPAARRAVVRALVDPVSRETLDQAVVLWMPGPASFTGEDVVELHMHGGPAVMSAVAETLLGLGARPAEAGEFSRRAFEHGKLDLVQAEAVADLIDADSAAQRRQALGQLAGGVSRQVEGWRNLLLTALASFEAAIDFPDEEVPAAVADRARAPLLELLAGLRAATDDHRGERVREGYRIALIGAPNAGKSSLLNRLVGRDAAIVADVPGTTRDVIEQPLELAGHRILLADTAGIRGAAEGIEAEGVRRARAWSAKAALRLWIVDGGSASGVWREAMDEARQGDILVLNKADTPAGEDRRAATDAADALELEPVDASALSDEGVGELRELLARRIIRDLGGDEAPPITRMRHRRLLNAAVGHVESALGGVGDAELMAEDVRLAARALEAFTGRVDAEAVLGEVFSSFCIGK